MDRPDCGIKRVPIMVLEGKREVHNDITILMQQCWEQASYCFDTYRELHPSMMQSGIEWLNIRRHCSD